MKRVLVVEDSRDVNLLLANTLKGDGYEVESVFDGLSAINIIRSNNFDVILLDIMLPYKRGDEILKEIRNLCEVPVIIISAKDLVGTKIDFLKLGADDYITKPFDLGEVLARVEAQIRRYNFSNSENSVIKYKDIQLNCNSKVVIVNGCELILTAKEYKILEIFMKNKDKVFSKCNLYESIWKGEYLGDDNAVKTHISNLRNKLKKANDSEEYIETVWGLGYRLCK
ncbi:response regulator transcription factor [Clostridium bornimense]|uniref:response regulator transcription factor n=1 Tax=Clostridium bornimense TaxID=1216932 RepID=UPI001C10BD7E|nr:response regulator transcription factor [Clostridium bornimense]MBU5316371.1 response regulator transcription factor [Clostridium bornimense]